jgi:hypothetical protein
VTYTLTGRVWESRIYEMLVVSRQNRTFDSPILLLRKGIFTFRRAEAPSPSVDQDLDTDHGQ